MINLIVGTKGSGKTKTLIDLINTAAKNTKGNVVCIEKGLKLTYDLDYSVRLVDIEQFGVSGFDAFYGFIAGILSSDHDCTDIFVDATLKITGRDYAKVGEMFEALAKISPDTTITLTVSADNAELPESVLKFIG